MGRSNINLVGNTTEVINLGTGEGVFYNKVSGNTLQFKTLTGYSNTVNITSDDNHIYFSANTDGTGGLTNFSGYTCTTNNSISIGDDTMSYLTSSGASYNVAMGYQSMICEVTGNYNVALGALTLCCNTTGIGNVAIGNSTMRNNCDGDCNVGIGVGVLNNNQIGCFNVGIGASALNGNTSGQDNVALGQGTMKDNTTGQNNIAFGERTFGKNTSGNHNFAVGYTTLCSNVSGSDNIGLGKCAGYSATGSNNIFVGNKAGINETNSNKLYIGCGDINGDTLMYGEFDNKLLCIDNKLVTNCFQMISGATDGYVLTSDGSGNATWAEGGGGTSYWSSGATGLSPAAAENIYLPTGDKLMWDDSSCVVSSGGALELCGGAVAMRNGSEYMQVSAGFLRLCAPTIYLGQSASFIAINNTTKKTCVANFNCYDLILCGGASSNSSLAGDLELIGGNSSSTGAGGNVKLCAGVSSSGADGRIILCNLPAQSTESDIVYIDASGNLSCGAGGSLWTSGTAILCTTTPSKSVRLDNGTCYGWKNGVYIRANSGSSSNSFCMDTGSAKISMSLGSVVSLQGNAFAMANYNYSEYMQFYSSGGITSTSNMTISPHTSGSLYLGNLPNIDAACTLQIDSNDKVSYCVDSSDCRLKCNLEPINNTASMLDTICGYSAEFNTLSELSGTCQYVMLAQDVETHLPLAVYDDVHIGDECYKRIDYKQLIPVMWNLIKEQEIRIKILEG